MAKDEFVMSVDELKELGYFPDGTYEVCKQVAEKYPVKIPYFYLQLMDSVKRPQELTRLCIPSPEEIMVNNFSLEDPIGDKTHEKGSGFVHRYKNRLLVIPTTNCFIFCRHCFRKNLLKDNQIAHLENVCIYLKEHPEINEVIFSGGDPLILGNDALYTWFETLYRLSNVKKIRIHTRATVVNPERFTDDLYKLFSEYPLTIVLATHINHPLELTMECKRTIRALRKTGVINVSQTVLLRGVNDCVETLQELFEALTTEGVIPYYLHQNDLVAGGAHFAVSIKTGAQLVSQLWGRISGLSIPQYVLDIPGGYGKIPIDLGRCLEQQDRYEVHGLNGYIGHYQMK